MSGKMAQPLQQTQALVRVPEFVAVERDDGQRHVAGKRSETKTRKKQEHEVRSRGITASARLALTRRIRLNRRPRAGR